MKNGIVALTKQYKFLLHGIMIFTAVATLMLFFAPKISMPLYTIGASSGYIAFGVVTAETTQYGIGLAAFAWVLLFPIVLLISYVLALKKHYVPFCVVMILDLLIVILWLIYALITDNIYGFKRFIPDFFVSLAFAIFLIRKTILLKRKKNSSLADT